MGFENQLIVSYVFKKNDQTNPFDISSESLTLQDEIEFTPVKSDNNKINILNVVIVKVKALLNYQMIRISLYSAIFLMLTFLIMHKNVFIVKVKALK